MVIVFLGFFFGVDVNNLFKVFGVNVFVGVIDVL